MRSDERAGTRRSLSEYLRLFPDHQEIVAWEYLAYVGHARSDESEASSSGHGIDAAAIGPYVLEAEIGRGGQGAVYRARDTRLGRIVALKVLTGLGPGAHRQLQRFRREAEIAARLEHPGICGIHDTGLSDGVPYIAMRYIEGQTLAERLRAERRQDDAPTPSNVTRSIEFSFEISGETPEESPAPEPSQASAVTTAMTRDRLNVLLLFFERAARALHAAHEAGVLHRDIKPGNIMITRDGDPVILDFGLAQEEGDEAITLTNTGDVVGTPAYMSPEQVAGTRVKLDARSDVYSLGVTLYETLTLHRPFEGPTREGLYQAIMTKAAPAARSFNRGLPADLEVVLDCALEKDRNKRYGSAAAFADDLAAVRELRPIAARPIGRSGRLIRWSKRQPTLAALALVLILGVPLLFGLGGYIWANLPNIAAQRRAENAAELEEALEEGFFEMHHGDKAKALSWFERASRLDPTSTEAVAGAALVHLARRAPESARSVLDGAGRDVAEPSALDGLRRDVGSIVDGQSGNEPPSSRPTQELSAVRAFVEGCRALRRGEGSDPTSNAGEAEFQRAVVYLRHAVFSSHDARRSWFLQLAHAVGHRGKTANPEEVVDAIRELWPESKMARRWCGFALISADPVRAEKLLRDAVESEPDVATLRKWHAASLQAVDEIEKTEKATENAQPAEGK